LAIAPDLATLAASTKRTDHHGQPHPFRGAAFDPSRANGGAQLQRPATHARSTASGR
jgi:hypothetical protein